MRANLTSTGFTLIELLLTLAIFIMVGTTLTPLYGNLSVATQLNEETSQLVQTIRLARERAVSGFFASRHGVCFESGAGASRYIFYQGANCAARVAAADRVTVLPPALTWSSTLPLPDINFNSTGAPSVTGTVSLVHATAGQRVISINDLGLVEEQ